MTACKTAHGPVDRRLFPPQQQHKIVALVTQPPQEQGHPITHWSISDLARVTVQKEIVGSIARIEHEYIRHGTCCLTAGLEVATGSIMGMLTANRPVEVFAEFMAWVCDYYADARKIHIVLDNLNTHYHEQTCQVVAQACERKLNEIKTGQQRKDFLTRSSKRVVFHFTPSYASWLNQIEIWFSTLTRKVIRRGDFSSIADLESKIVEFIKYYNKYLAKPYQWTYTGKPLAAFRKVA